MQQTTIYEYLGYEQDPIFKMIDELKKGSSIKLDKAIISLNNLGIYEINSSSTHEGFKEKSVCYAYLTSLLGFTEIQ